MNAFNSLLTAALVRQRIDDLRRDASAPRRVRRGRARGN
jgi:hypothetical protein